MASVFLLLINHLYSMHDNVFVVQKEKAEFASNYIDVFSAKRGCIFSPEDMDIL